MAAKEIKLLQDQINKLDDKGFDLESWKIYTIGLLDRIFGHQSHKIDQMKELKYDFSSWSLRDTSGSPDSIKKKARVIVESAIREIEHFGLPDKEKGKNEESTNPLTEILKDELKGTDYKRIMKVVNENKSDEIKTGHLTDFLNDMDTETKDQIIINLLKQI
ncbi:MAG: hypothetical protein ABFS35_02805 [Bacteroidota bacterium]